MDTENLLTMANQIGAFYETMPERQQALQDIVSHIKKFWTPRMRAALLAHCDANTISGLSPVVQEALRIHRELL